MVSATLNWSAAKSQLRFPRLRSIIHTSPAGPNAERIQAMQANTECQFHYACAYYAQSELHRQGETLACCGHDALPKLDGWRARNPQPLDMELISAHGVDHGLMVTLADRIVTVKDWRQLCEPDENGDWRPELQHYSCSLAEALSWATEEGCVHPSMRSRVISGALRGMSHNGPDDTDYLDESAEPAHHFDEDLDAHTTAA